MQTVLVTLNGPGSSIDLELPGDVPIRDLLAELTKLWEPPAEEPTEPLHWMLSREGGGVLDAARTLIECGVMDGAVLGLQDSVSLARQREQAAQLAPGIIQPGPQTGGIGIRWNKEGWLKES